MNIWLAIRTFKTLLKTYFTLSTTIIVWTSTLQARKKTLKTLNWVKQNAFKTKWNFIARVRVQLGLRLKIGERNCQVFKRRNLERNSRQLKSSKCKDLSSNCQLKEPRKKINHMSVKNQTPIWTQMRKTIQSLSKIKTTPSSRRISQSSLLQLDRNKIKISRHKLSNVESKCKRSTTDLNSINI